MSDIEMIKIIFGIMLSIGSIILLLLSYFLGYKYLVMEKKCTDKTRGIVKKYTLSDRGGEHSGVHLPIVSYQVDGHNYKVTGPEYKGYVTITTSTPFDKNEMEYNIHDQILKINRTSNSFVKVYQNPFQELYPVGSEIDVYYDPNNPKLSYVLRYCNKKWVFWLLFISGLAVSIIDIAILVLL